MRCSELPHVAPWLVTPLFLSSLALSSVACAPPSPARGQSAPQATAPTTAPTTAPAPSQSAAPSAPPATPPPPSPPASAADATHFKWQLEVEPKTMSMAQRSSCRIRITVTNEGTKSSSPNLYLADWTLNGMPSRGLSMAFQNGASTKRLYNLPPKETVSAERAACRLMDQPGHYTVGFRHGAVELTAEVDVTP